MTRVTLLAAGLVLAALSPAAAQDARVEALRWMAGCWVAASGGAHVQEVWMAPRGGTMLGMQRDVREGRTIGYELLRLHVRAGGIVYSAHPSGQAPADFAAVEVGLGSARFEKPDHDFPKRIDYRRTSPDSLIARVYGEVDAASPAFEVRYGRGDCGGG